MTQKSTGNWEVELENILETNFPKLNQDDPTKPSPNNRSAALVMYAQIKLLILKLLDYKNKAVIEEINNMKCKICNTFLIKIGCPCTNHGGAIWQCENCKKVSLF